MEIRQIENPDGSVDFEWKITRKEPLPPRYCRVCQKVDEAWRFSRLHDLEICFLCEMGAREMPRTWPFMPVRDSWVYQHALPSELLIGRSVLWELEREIDRQKAA